MIEPLMNCRNYKEDVKTKGWVFPWEKPGRNLFTDSGGIRLIGGVTPRQALVWNVGTSPMMRRDHSKRQTRKDRSPDAWVRGRWVRSSVEGS